MTLKLAVEKACAAELTDRETSALQGEVINKLDTKECFRCGKNNHVPDKCFFRKAKCRGCQSIGHIVKKCPEKPDNNNSKLTKAKGKDERKKKRKPRGIRNLTVNSDSGSDSESQEEVMKPA